MTGRKPPGVRWESWIERQIREGIERGEFDDLPGAGKPLADLDRPRDELAWVHEKLRREQVSLLPATLALRRELEVTLERIGSCDDEEDVRRLIDAVNQRIRHVNTYASSGPPSTLSPLDVEVVVQRWRAVRADPHGVPDEPDPDAG